LTLNYSRCKKCSWCSFSSSVLNSGLSGS